MQSFIDSKLLERLRVGPLAPYLDVYLRRIEQDGFLPSSVPCQAYAIARFSKWLQQEGTRLEDLDEIIVRRFLDRDPGVVHVHEPATIRRLLLTLREMGVVKPEPPPSVPPFSSVSPNTVDTSRTNVGWPKVASRTIFHTWICSFLSGLPKASHVLWSSARRMLRHL